MRSKYLTYLKRIQCDFVYTDSLFYVVPTGLDFVGLDYFYNYDVPNGTFSAIKWINSYGTSNLFFEICLVRDKISLEKS